jgi:hypothetical protein
MAVNVQYMVDLFDGKSAAFEANGIHARVTQRLAGSLDKGRYVLADQGTSGDKRVLPDFDELVHGTHPCQDRMISHGYVPGYLRVVAENDIVPDLAVMRDMRVGHNQAVPANRSGKPVLGTAMDGNKFPDGGIVANVHGRFFTFEFQVLGGGGQHGAWKDPAVAADAGAFHDRNIASDPGAFADFHVVVDHGKGIDLDICCHAGVGVDIRVRMDHVIL